MIIPLSRHLTNTSKICSQTLSFHLKLYGLIFQSKAANHECWCEFRPPHNTKPRRLHVFLSRTNSIFLNSFGLPPGLPAETLILNQTDLAEVTSASIRPQTIKLQVQFNQKEGKGTFLKRLSSEAFKHFFCTCVDSERWILFLKRSLKE